MRLPAPPRAHDVEEAPDVGGHRRRRRPRQNLFEMPPRQAVLLLQEESVCEFQTHTHQFRAVHQDGPERRNRLVELPVAGVPVRGGLRGGERLHARPEPLAGRILAVGGGGEQIQPGGNDESGYAHGNPCP